MAARIRILLLIYSFCVTAIEGRVLRVEITSQTALPGEYERLNGHVYFAVSVANPHNRGIVDLANAVNLKDGEVAFSADFMAIRPKDPKKSNGTLLLEVPNRGSPRIIALVDGGNWNLEHDAGDAWLLREGYTVAALGWQWDATGPDALRIQVPVAKDHGKTITGLLRGDLMLSHTAEEIPLGHLISGHIGGTEYPVSAPDDPQNVLTVRDARDAPRQTVPRKQWQFAHDMDGKLVASDRFIHLDSGGFAPGRIYEYVYVVKDPAIAGLGFAAVRDFASYAKHAPDTVLPVKRVLGEGISQNGRFLRDFLYQGFNADENGGMALDGVLAHVAGAGRGSFNYRFAQPSRDAQPTSSVFFPTDVFPFTEEDETDSVTGAQGGLLDRTKRDHVTPKIFFSNTSYEYWGRVASLIHTSADGKRDVALSDSVRIYHFTGLQHFSGPFPPTKGQGDLDGQQPQSPLPIRYFWRAMITNMNAWVENGTLPPASSYPKIANGTLVPLDGYRFPALPGVHIPHEANQAYRIDFGPNWQAGILSREPPKAGVPFPVLVPQVDADGNERDGVRLPEITVPLATYTGWNLRDPSIGAPGQRVSFEGSCLLFPHTAADRKRLDDPRPSIEERYLSREDYLKRFGDSLDDLIRERWVLAEDRASLLERGAREWDSATR